MAITPVDVVENLLAIMLVDTMKEYSWPYPSNLLLDVRFCVVHLSYIFCSSKFIWRNWWGQALTSVYMKELHHNYLIWILLQQRTCHSSGRFIYRDLISSIHCDIWTVATHVTSSEKDIWLLNQFLQPGQIKKSKAQVYIFHLFLEWTTIPLHLSGSLPF